MRTNFILLFFLICCPKWLWAQSIITQYAAIENDLKKDFIVKLLNQPASFTDSNGNNILHQLLTTDSLTFRQACQPLFEQLLSFQPIRDLAQQANYMGEIPLQIACKNNHYDAIEALYLQGTYFPDKQKISLDSLPKDAKCVKLITYTQAKPYFPRHLEKKEGLDLSINPLLNVPSKRFSDIILHGIWTEQIPIYYPNDTPKSLNKFKAEILLPKEYEDDLDLYYFFRDFLHYQIVSNAQIQHAQAPLLRQVIGINIYHPEDKTQIIAKVKYEDLVRFWQIDQKSVWDNFENKNVQNIVYLDFMDSKYYDEYIEEITKHLTQNHLSAYNHKGKLINDFNYKYDQPVSIGIQLIEQSLFLRFAPGEIPSKAPSYLVNLSKAQFVMPELFPLPNLRKVVGFEEVFLHGFYLSENSQYIGELPEEWLRLASDILEHKSLYFNNMHVSAQRSVRSYRAEYPLYIKAKALLKPKKQMRFVNHLLKGLLEGEIEAQSTPIQTFNKEMPSHTLEKEEINDLLQTYFLPINETTDPSEKNSRKVISAKHFLKFEFYADLIFDLTGTTFEIKPAYLALVFDSSYDRYGLERAVGFVKIADFQAFFDQKKEFSKRYKGKLLSLSEQILLHWPSYILYFSGTFLEFTD